MKLGYERDGSLKILRLPNGTILYAEPSDFISSCFYTDKAEALRAGVALAQRQIAGYKNNVHGKRDAEARLLRYQQELKEIE